MQRLVPFVFGAAGLGLGIAMVHFGLAGYDVLPSTISMGISASIAFRQAIPYTDRMAKKSWKITGGLVEGYDMAQGKLHTIEEVESAYLDWFKFRGDLPILAGTLAPIRIVYRLKNAGAVAIEDMDKGVSEPSWCAAGELSPKYDQVCILPSPIVSGERLTHTPKGKERRRGQGDAAQPLHLSGETARPEARVLYLPRGAVRILPSSEYLRNPSTDARTLGTRWRFHKNNYRMDTPLLTEKKNDPTMRELYERLVPRVPVPRALAPKRDSYALVCAKIDEGVRVHKAKLLAGNKRAYRFIIHFGVFNEGWSKLPALRDGDWYVHPRAEVWAYERHGLHVVLRDSTFPFRAIIFSVLEPTAYQSCIMQ